MGWSRGALLLDVTPGLILEGHSHLTQTECPRAS